MSVAADYVGMDPLPLDLPIYQGATFKKTVTWRDAANAPIDLSSCTGRMKARDMGQEIPPAGVQAVPIDVVVIDLTTSDGLTFGGATGTVMMDIAAEDTANIGIGVYPYDLEVVTAASEVIRLLSGTARVYPEYTR